MITFLVSVQTQEIRLGDLMNALMANGGQASLKLLAAETGLHPSTAFRILSAAIDNGWIGRNDACGYRRATRSLAVDEEAAPAARRFPNVSVTSNPGSLPSTMAL